MTVAAAYAGHVRLAILLRLLEPPEDHCRRLHLLRLAAGLPGGSASVSLLHELAAGYRAPPPRDLVATDAAWLAEQRLAVPGAIPGCTLTTRGLDVAAGRAAAPGVAPVPSPAWLLDGLHAVQLRIGDADLLAELAWLAAARLIVRDEDGAAWLTPRGLDAARGRAAVDGVRSPSPEAALRLAARLAAGGLEGPA